MTAAPQEASQAAGLRYVGAMLSDVGRERQLNEDAVAFVVPPEGAAAEPRNGLMLVADGMGGHSAGEVASAIAAEVMRRCFFELKGSVADILSTAFTAANKAIFDYGQRHPECAGMGTTCTVLLIRADKIWLGHVGDSRAYLLRGSQLRQLSEDHTLVARMVRDGTMTAQEAKTSEHSNVILQALGAGAEIEPQLWTKGTALLPDDVLIVCSDGLHGLVDDDVIAEVAGRMAPAEACEELIHRALAAGGHDNVSVGVLRAFAASADAAAADNDTRRIPAADATRSTRQLPVFEGQS
jgi:PPM family protein phosphatase